jgi:ribonuclease HI
MPSEPSLEEVLRTIAAEVPLDNAALKLGLEPARIAALLEEAATALQWRIPARAARAEQTELRPKPAASTRPAPLETAPTPENVKRVFIYSDGAARGNPGPAGAGVVIKTTDGAIIARLGKFLGVQTNNVAEYEGVLLGLTKALEMGVREVVLRADSLLAINQLKGEWKIKNEGLRPLYDDAKQLLRRFDRVVLQHVPREQNTDADEMSNRAIDERM